MCAINGIFSYAGPAPQTVVEELRSTRDFMSHRGPDGFGEWWSSSKSIGLGHRRLSIIDLSDNASQPLSTRCGRYSIVFNGEIYNYEELRSTLESRGVLFSTSSDTEVILEMFREHGAGMLSFLRGMFAFAIWDNVDNSLLLARDPYGIKPLYIADDGYHFRFASQAKALVHGGSLPKAISPGGIVGYYLMGSVPEPFTIYEGITPLPPGHWMKVTCCGAKKSIQYASIAQSFVDGASAPISHVKLEEFIRDAVYESLRYHLVSDVEVGVFLSAGIDSGALLGLMHDAGQRGIKAVTLAFDEFAGTNDDESKLAAHVAKRYGADHYIKSVSREEFRSDLPKIIDAMDQPSIDGINTWFVSKAASEANLKVVLSGVGGDEIFAGYPSFTDVPRLVAATRAINSVPGAAFLANRLARVSGLSNRRPKLSGLFEYGGTFPGSYFIRRALYLPDELRGLISEDTLELGLQELNMEIALAKSMEPDPVDSKARVATLESTNYMKNQLLRDSDWASMAHSLELRTPLVDFSLLSRLSRVTPVINARAGKMALANAPSLPLPNCISKRAKTGFSVPMGKWSQSANGAKNGLSGLASRSWASEVVKHFL